MMNTADRRAEHRPDHFADEPGSQRSTPALGFLSTRNCGCHGFAGVFVAAGATTDQIPLLTRPGLQPQRRPVAAIQSATGRPDGTHRGVVPAAIAALSSSQSMPLPPQVSARTGTTARHPHSHAGVDGHGLSTRSLDAVRRPVPAVWRPYDGAAVQPDEPFSPMGTASWQPSIRPGCSRWAPPFRASARPDRRPDTAQVAAMETATWPL